MQKLVKVLQTNLFFVQFDYIFENFSQFHVNSAIHEVVHVLTLLQLLGSIILEYVIGHIAHAVLGELGADSLLGNSLQISLLDLDVVGCNALMLPSKFFST